MNIIKYQHVQCNQFQLRISNMKFVVFFMIFLFGCKISYSQSEGSSFKQKKYWKKKSVSILGDFPVCDSCFLVVVNVKNQRVDKDFKLTNFTFHIVSNNKKINSFAQGGGVNVFSDEIKVFINSAPKGSFITIEDICVEYMNEFVYILKPIEIKLE